MADYIKINRPNNQAEQKGTVIPEKDGFFEITVRADATGNGRDYPIIWADIWVDGVSIEHQKIAWKDGVGGIDISDAYPMKAGTKYEISATSGNQNADATGIKMAITRVA